MSANAVLAGQVAIRAQIEGIQDSIQDLEKFRKKIERMSTSTNKLAKGWTKFIAALVAINVVQRNIGKIAKSVEETVEHFDSLAKNAQRFGMSAADFREIDGIMSHMGLTTEEMATAFSAMQRNVSGAFMGTGEAMSVFEQAGTDIEKLRGLDPVALFDEMVDVINSFGTETERAGAAQKIFGESGQKLFPLINQGSGAIDKLREAYRTLNGEMTSEDIAKFERLNDIMKAFKTNVQAGFANLIVSFAPTIENMFLQGIALSTTFQEMNLDGVNEDLAESEDHLANAALQAERWGQALGLAVVAGEALQAAFIGINSSVAAIVYALTDFLSITLEVQSLFAGNTSIGLGLGLAADHAGRLADNLYEAAEDGFASMPNRINRVVNGMGQIEELGAKNVANLANAGAAQLDLQGSQEKIISAMKKMQNLTRQMAEDEANRRKEVERIINLSKMFNGSVTEVTGAAGVQAGSNLYQSFIQNELLKTIARNTENAAKIEAR